MDDNEAARNAAKKEMAMMQMMSGASANDKKAMVEQAMAANVMSALKVVEAKMDEDIEQLNKMEEMGETELDLLRDRRKEAMKKAAAKRQEWRANGHGEYKEVRGEKDFFREVKGEEKAVVHFFRSSTIRCNIVDRHLSDLSKTHLETKFLKVDAEKSPFLVERLHIWMMPSILIIKNGKTDHTITGFEEFGGTDDFSTRMVEYVLGNHGALNYSGPPPEDPTDDGSVHVSRFSKRAVRTKKGNLEEDADWWD